MLQPPVVRVCHMTVMEMAADTAYQPLGLSRKAYRLCSMIFLPKLHRFPPKQYVESLWQSWESFTHRCGL